MRVAYSLLLLLGLILPVCALGSEPQPDCNNPSTQLDMNICEGKALTAADMQLNKVWQAILLKYKDEPLFLEKLKASQKLWLQFRDAEIAAHFPLKKGDNSNVQYGSVYPMCVSNLQAELTRQRTQQLQAWLDGAQEGDTCSGSIKNSADLK